MAHVRAWTCPPGRVAGFAGFADLLRRLASRAAPWPGELADAVAWLAPAIETRYDDAAARIGDLEALERIAGSFASRERFLSELTLDPPDATSDEAGPPLRDEDYLILSTIHSAKGQEWRSVFVLELRRRLHPLRSRDRLVGGDRGGAPAPLCGDDPGQGRTHAARPAALLRPRPAEDAATAACSPAAPASFPRRCSSTSSARPGRPPQRRRPGRPRTPPGWTWPRGCGPCGGDEQMTGRRRRRSPAPLAALAARSVRQAGARAVLRANQ